LPPIEVYKVGEAYFVIDGNHRVSIAKQEKFISIEARVIEVRTDVPLTPDIQPDDLIVKAEYAQFINDTQIMDLRPNVDLSVTIPGQYEILLAQIHLQKFVLVEDQKLNASLQDAVVDWYDNIYIPLAETIRDRGLLRWFPDRTWAGRSYVPVTARTTTGLEVFGYVSFAPGHRDENGDDVEPGEFDAVADFTDELAERHPEWRMDICEEVVGGWRGENGAVAAMTLVWGVPLVHGGRVATAELSNLAVDQCAIQNDRFTLLAPDAYRSDYLDIKLWDGDGRELAAESLYVEDDV